MIYVLDRPSWKYRDLFVKIIGLLVNMSIAYNVLVLNGIESDLRSYFYVVENKKQTFYVEHLNIAF